MPWIGMVSSRVRMKTNQVCQNPRWRPTMLIRAAYCTAVASRQEHRAADEVRPSSAAVELVELRFRPRRQRSQPRDARNQARDQRPRPWDDERQQYPSPTMKAPPAARTTAGGSTVAVKRNATTATSERLTTSRIRATIALPDPRATPTENRVRARATNVTSAEGPEDAAGRLPTRRRCAPSSSRALPRRL